MSTVCYCRWLTMYDKVDTSNKSHGNQNSPRHLRGLFFVNTYKNTVYLQYHPLFSFVLKNTHTITALFPHLTYT